MRNLKKFLALVLALVMAMSLMTFADAKVVNSTPFDDEPTYEEAGQAGYSQFDQSIAVLNAIGVIKGDRKDINDPNSPLNFRPGETITRAEVAAILYRIMTGDTSDNQAPLYRNVNHPFGDVSADKWYAGYVGYLWNAKIVKGDQNSNFRPSDPITGHEVLAMVLRAVGYDANNEFSGANWQITVAATAQQEGILDEINKENYNADHLYYAARRGVVASMVFQTIAYVNQVQWTAAFSYQKTGMAFNAYTGLPTSGLTSNNLNPTLGQQIFGLSSVTGIIVGDQATGEDNVRLGRGVVFSYNNDGTLADADGRTSYAYERDSNVSGNTITAAASGGNVTATYVSTFTGVTPGLEQFGHLVRMWYDGRTGYTSNVKLEDSSANDVTVKAINSANAYLAYDLAVRDEVVFAESTKTKGTTLDIDIIEAAKDAGFSDASGNIYVSDRYGRMTLDTTGDITKSKVGLYRLIANGDNNYDVIVELNQEVATITQINDSDSRGNYVVLGNGNQSANVGRLEGVNGSEFGVTMQNGKGQIMSSKLRGNSMSFASIKANNQLGTLVTATEIVGTKAAAPSGQTEDYFYELKELTRAFTGTVSSYVLTQTGSGKVQSMTLATTERYALSGITGSLDPWNFDTYSHLVNGLTVLTSADLNISYDFFTDAAGRVIGVRAPNDYQFVYTTFADYEIGALGTGTSAYYVYGVDWNGQQVLGKKLNSITQPYYNNSGVYAFDDIVNAGSYKTVTGNFNGYETMSLEDGRLAYAYTMLPVTMKNQGNANAGNQIREGNNTRYMLDSNGNLAWNNVGGEYGRRFIGWYDDSVNAIRDTWTITAADAANGFLRVYNQEFSAQMLNDPQSPGSSNNIGYVITNNTKFVVVHGSGTADLEVEPVYTGMSAFLNGSSGAEISFTGGDNVYFKVTDDKYGNADTTGNRIIDTVIMSDTNLTRFTSRNVYFSAPGNTAVSNSTLVGAPAGSRIHQYQLYNNGNLETYWIDENVSMDYTGNLGSADGEAQIGSFYTLARINTINGTPVYRATAVVATGTGNKYGKLTTGCFTGTTNQNDATDGPAPVPANRYHYVAVSDTSTAEIGNKVFSVAKDVVVAEAFGTNPGNTLTNTINSLSTLNWAIAKYDATGYTAPQFDVDVAFVYDGITVTCIYVIGIQPAAGYTP